MDKIVTIVAKYFIVFSVIGVGILLIRLKGRIRFQFLALLAVGGVLSLIFSKIGSHLYTNPRPFVQGHFTPLISHGADNGFPSDHTLLASFLGWASLPYSRKMGVALLVLAALIGGARMAAGVHHLIDIIGSFALSALGAWLAGMLVRRVYAVAPKPTITERH